MSFDDSPDGSLDQIQQVMILPEAHQTDDRKIKHLREKQSFLVSLQLNGARYKCYTESVTALEMSHVPLQYAIVNKAIKQACLS